VYLVRHGKIKQINIYLINVREGIYKVINSENYDKGAMVA